MKNILITGRNSYIGNNIESWLSNSDNAYLVTSIDVKGKDWQDMNWSNFDIVINVAGIAHRKETEENEKLYYEINRDLAIKLAKKAKKEKVQHFIQFSTMSVFGKSTGIITNDTPTNPTNHYGRSKLEADSKLTDLRSSNFIVSVIRPPMVYGSGCPGNYQKLSNFIKKIRVFPKISNKRSMIYISNLTECIKQIIDNQMSGIFYPQNEEYINTYNLALQVSKENNIKLMTIPNLLNWTRILIYISSQANKVIGDLIYDKKLSEIYDQNHRPIKYNVADFVESVRLTENEN